MLDLNTISANRIQMINKSTMIVNSQQSTFNSKPLNECIVSQNPFVGYIIPTEEVNDIYVTCKHIVFALMHSGHNHIRLLIHIVYMVYSDVMLD